MSSSKSAIVVGASSGIGEALAKRLARAGYRVALVARRAEELEKLAGVINRRDKDRARVYPHDVTHFDEDLLCSSDTDRARNAIQRVL